MGITFRKHKRVCVLFSMLFVMQILFAVILMADITPLILSVYLIYMHLFAMRDPFYEEVSGI